MLGELEVDKIFKRKYENTSETSTQSNEMSNKICHQHYDHSYAKNIIIDLVNDDCLCEIFMYVPICERLKIAQVCKKWNRVLYSYCFKLKKFVLSHWEYDRPQNALKQFKTNKRKLSFLRSFLNNSCNYLTELDLVAYDNSNIVPILNDSCPNLVKLRLRLKYPFDNKDLENAFSGMSKLKILKIIIQRAFKIPSTLILSLRNVANTLNELTLISQSEGTFTLCQFSSSFLTIIPQLKALKKIEIGGMCITSYISEAIANAKLDFHYHEHIYKKLKEVINRELENITSLCLHKPYELTDDMLYNVANNFEFLNYFGGDCAFVTDVGIQAITKMKHLENLYLSGKNNVTDFPLKLLKGLKKLELPDSYNITNNSIEKILENSPYMQELAFKHTSITREFLTIVMEAAETRKIDMRLYVQFPGHCVDIIKRKYFFAHCYCEKKHSPNIFDSLNKNYL
ncbi:uncharacterized protein LOC122860150 [Aphidius gifuensis]|uniref:uncharacterized protein LOC122860150 n=1 Tax=Aphidius gifuensis TaxID=684658 RepID=UPI001CDC46F6|nr:uncharacterized protein LOC122860150 [Aphidius gifuensis]